MREALISSGLDAIRVASPDDYPESRALAITVYRQDFEKLAEQTFNCLLAPEPARLKRRSFRSAASSSNPPRWTDYFNAAGMSAASEVVGRPISALSWCWSSNKPPFDAPTSESASRLAIGSGRRTKQRGLVVGLGQIDVRDRLARLSAQFGRELGEGIRIVGEFMNFAGLCRCGQRNRSRFGVVGARGGRNTALAGTADEGAVLQRRRDARQIVLGAHQPLRKRTFGIPDSRR